MGKQAYLKTTAVPPASFNIHLTGVYGPIGEMMQVPTGSCMFAGPVYILPTLNSPFAVYIGCIDSVVEDILFIAILYQDSTPTNIEGEVRLFQVMSQEDNINFKTLSSSEIETTFTFNRRALHRCVFWEKLREGSWAEKESLTAKYARMEYEKLKEYWRDHRRRKRASLQWFKSSWKQFWGVPVRYDGLFLDIYNPIDKRADNFMPIDLSVTCVRICGSEISVAFVTLPVNTSLIRFLEKFAMFDWNKKPSVFDSVLGMATGTAEKRSDRVYRVRLKDKFHSKWKTTLEMEVVKKDFIKLHHCVKGVRVLGREMKFCQLNNDGIAFPEGTLCKEFLPDKFERTTLKDGSPGIFVNFMTLDTKKKREQTLIFRENIQNEV